MDKQMSSFAEFRLKHSHFEKQILQKLRLTPPLKLCSHYTSSWALSSGNICFC